MRIQAQDLLDLMIISGYFLSVLLVLCKKMKVVYFTHVRYINTECSDKYFLSNNKISRSCELLYV